MPFLLLMTRVLESSAGRPSKGTEMMQIRKDKKEEKLMRLE